MTTSRRTPPAAVAALRGRMGERDRLYEWRAGAAENPYFGLLAHADAFVVTGDSMSMITEVARLNRPLAIYPLRRSKWISAARNWLPDWIVDIPKRLKYELLPRIGFTAFPRDLTQIHRELFDAGFAVTAGEPMRRGNRPASDELDRVVGAVRQLANGSRTRPVNIRSASLPLVVTLISVTLSLAVAELVLRAVTPFPITEISNRHPDPDFGYVVSSDVPDVDARGFRNRGVSLEDAEVVVVGDSHTYGYNVDVTHAFPFVLGQLTHRRTYAMGIGGYGIYQYLALFHALERFHPQQVLLALYPANDLGSACSIVMLPSWRAVAREAGVATPTCDEPDTKESSLLQSSALVGAIDYAWVRLAPTGCREPAIRFEQGPCMTIERGERHTRLTSMDEADNRRRLADAFAILEYANSALHPRGRPLLGADTAVARARAVGMGTQTFARNRPAARSSGRSGDRTRGTLLRSVSRDARRSVKDATPDVVDAYAASVRDGTAFYPASSDGHPLAPGYAAYARAAVSLIESATAE